MSVKSGVPVPFGLLYRSNVTVPVGLLPPETVALSAIEVPTVADAGCWLVVIDGAAAVIVTGSAVAVAADRAVDAVSVVGRDPVSPSSPPVAL